MKLTHQVHKCLSWRNVVMPLVALAAMLFASEANASHYRGGAASYTINASGVVTVTAYTAWGPFDESPSFRVYTGSGQSGSALGAMSLASSGALPGGTELGGATYTARVDTYTFDLNGQAAGFYYAWWSSANYTNGINNVPESTWSVELKIAYTPGVASAGPTMLPVTVDIVGRGLPYTQNLNSVDPDGTPVTFTNLSGYTAPDYAPTSVVPGMSVSATGTVSIPGVSTQALALGRWGYKIRVTDGSGGTAIRDTLLVTYDPAGNQPPVLASIGPKTVNVNSNLNFTVSGTDPDTAQSVTVRAKLLPSGASCATQTGSATGTQTTFNWTPTSGQEGTYPVVFEVFDSAGVSLTDSEEVIITVTGSNNPPVLAAVGNKSVPNGGTLTFNLSATDPDGNAVTYQMFNGPPGATLSPAGAFSFSPTAGQNNTTFTGVTLRATDNGVPNLNDDESITITVGAGNNAPVTSATLSHTVSAGQPISFVVSGSDADSAQTLTLSANNGVPFGASFGTVSGLASAGVQSTFNWTPTIAQAGVVTVKFLTQDNGIPVLNHEITVTITVTTGPAPAEMNVTVGGLPSGPGYSFTGNSAVSAPLVADNVLGIRFTANANCTVTHLSTYDHNQDGLVRDTPVGLWDSSGNLLASTTVRSSDPLQGSFRTRALAVPVALTSGSSYRVGALVLAGDIYGSGQPLTMDSRITFGTDAYLNTSSLDFPTLTTNQGLATAGYFGGNFVLGGSGGTNVADGGSKDFGTLNVGNNTSLNFNIENLGEQDLTGLSITQSGSADFSITTSPTAPVTGPTGTTSFVVKFAPTSGGVKTATLQIANNDSNENPYDITLTGTGNALPVLSMPASPLVVEANSLGTSVVTYSVTANDQEDGPLTPTVNPPSGTAFSLGNTTVNVSVTDSRGAVTTGSFIVRVVTPDIAVERSGPVADGSTDNLGSVNNHSSTVFTYTVRNTGTSNLTGLTITKGGTHASEYTVSAVGTIPLAPSATTTFTVTFAPEYIGTRTADIHIASNDLDENPYDINLTTVSLPVFTPVVDKGSTPVGVEPGTTYHTFYDAYINSAKRVIYSAQLGTIGSVPVEIDQGTWTEGADGTLDLLMRAGTDLGNGQTVSRDFKFNRIADSGASLLQNTILGEGPVNVVQWIDDGFENITLFASRTTDYSSIGAFQGFTYTSQNQITGEGYFPSSLVQGGAGANAVTATNDSGVWRVDLEGSVTSVAREGDSMPVSVGVGLSQGTVKRAVVSTTDKGIYSTQVTGAGVTSLNAEVVMTRDFGTGAPGTMLARSDSQAAGLSVGCKYYGFIGETVNAAGKGLFWAQLAGSGVAASNNRALFSDRNGSVAPVIRYDDSLATPYGVGVKLSSISAFWLLDDNSVVIVGVLKGTGVSSVNDGFAAVVATNGTVSSIAREAQTLSVADNAKISVLQRIDVSPGGKISLLCSLVTGTGSPIVTTVSNNQVLFTTSVASPGTQLQLIRKGATVGSTTLSSITLSAQNVAGNTGATAGMSRLINDNGDACAILTLADGDEGVFVGP